MKPRKRMLRVLSAVLIVALLILSVYYFAFFPRNPSQVLTFNSKAENGAYVTEYPTQSSETTPNSIAVDSNGSVWFMLQNESRLAELYPSNGTIREYLLPGARNIGTITWGIIIQSSMNLIWFTEVVSNAVWSFDYRTNAFTKYAIPTANAFPFGITLDQNGNVWFTELFANKLGEINSSTGNVTEVNVSIPNASDPEPSVLIADNSGRLWMTLPGISGLASYAFGKFQFYNLTGLIYSPVSLVMDRQGNIWITQHGPNLLSEFNPTTHYFKSISTSVPKLNYSLPYFDYLDTKGNIWFNEHTGNSISMFNPQTQTLTEYEVPTRLTYTGGIAGVLTMTLSSNDTPWFAEFFSGKVGMVNTSKPVQLSLGIQNRAGLFGNTIRIENRSDVSISLSVNNSYSSQVILETSIGNLSSSIVTAVSPPSSATGSAPGNSTENIGLSFSFSANSQSGSFNSTLTITNGGAKSGVYFVTVSAVTTNVVVSRVIEVNVP